MAMVAFFFVFWGNHLEAHSKYVCLMNYKLCECFPFSLDNSVLRFITSCPWLPQVPTCDSKLQVHY